MRTIARKKREGFTLVEMMVVVALLAIVAALVVTRCSRAMERAKITAAETDLKTLKQAFVDRDGGYLRDFEGIPGASTGCLRVGNLLVATNVFGTALVNGGIAQERSVRVDIGTEAQCVAEGRALPEVFTTWNERRGRGWRGPYVKASLGYFPGRDDVRYSGDATFGERGFFPSLEHLRLPAEFKDPTRASVYGFIGEPAMMDPWGNPYVLQIPPPQAFPGVTNVAERVRFAYARIVSAGPNGILETPCFGANTTNFWGATGWDERRRRLSRQAGLIDETDRSARGDDLVLFFSRNDIDEGRDFDHD